MVAVVKPTPAPQPVVHKLHCPVCGRYLGETTAQQGTATVKCNGCNKWRPVTIGRVVN
jgi:transcription elongation factor Elf1